MLSKGSGGVEYLLLRRIAAHGGFWQSITGSLEDAETHREAAVREVREETGYELDADELMDLELMNRFEISPLWRSKYEPGVTHNEEVCFWARVEKRDITLDEREHDSFIWADYETALGLLHWESNKRAMRKLKVLSAEC